MSQNTGVFSHPDHDGHESVVFHSDPASGLRAIIAIHNRALGPAAGGCRIYPYPDGMTALSDALRLSRGMSYKNALAGLPLGGGKAVIIADPQTDKTEAKMRAFGRAVEGLAGRYVTGEDVGCAVADMDAVKCETAHVMGASDAEGDPSTHTARGVFLCMERAVLNRLGRTLDGVHVAIKGAGNVGYALARMLHERGARLTVAEPRDDIRDRAVAELGAAVAGLDDIVTAEADVFAPCALGGDLTAEAVANMRCAIVCGAANNQLAEPRVDGLLCDRGVLYCPDYLVNAGGIIAIGRTVAGWTEDQALAAIDRLPETLDRVLADAADSGAPTGEVADALARARMQDAPA